MRQEVQAWAARELSWFREYCGTACVLIVVETVVIVLSGGQPNQGSRPDGEPTPSASVVVPVPTAPSSVDVDLSARVLQLAETWLGVPYQFGGCSRGGVDCSCLVENVYDAVRIRLPRIAVDQFNATVPISDPQPGDLVFFANTYEPGISHVGIYLVGGVQTNAPTTGETVSVAPVFTGYWGSHYADAHRVRSLKGVVRWAAVELYGNLAPMRILAVSDQHTQRDRPIDRIVCHVVRNEQERAKKLGVLAPDNAILTRK